MRIAYNIRICLLALLAVDAGYAGDYLSSASSSEGYLARLLVNEVPFPGERAYVSEDDTRAAMDQLLHVLDNRLENVPNPYRQQQIASVKSTDLLDIITAGGEKGQFDGFYRNAAGQPVTVPRVQERIDNLTRIANQGQPGKFARLLTYAQTIATDFVRSGKVPVDRHAALIRAENTRATGGGYGWMTDEMRYHPGGNFLRIDDQDQGGLGGNRFYTLREQPR